MKIKKKRKTILFILTFVLFYSCDFPTIYDDATYGFDFTIKNLTDKEFTGFTLYFGKMEANKFVATDSIKNSVKIYKRNEGPRIGQSVEDGEWSILGIEEGVFEGLGNLNHQGRWNGSEENKNSPYAKIKLSDESFVIGTKTTGLTGYNITLLIEENNLEIISRAN